MVHGVKLWGQLLPEKVQMEVLVTELLSGSTKKGYPAYSESKTFYSKKSGRKLA